ncbi:MAG: helix-turn-helix transcriptional regulator [Mangrovicoccus sp.]|nr:helix-turn-helix transcriptional regulator [Mangrovicoccus sp.]
MSSENAKIGARLREIRDRTGLNQQDFAEAIGTSYRSYRAYESGQREVPTSVVLKLHEVLGSSPSELLLGKQQGLDGLPLEVLEEALTKGLTQIHATKNSRSISETASFLKLVIKLSLQQGDCLSDEDIFEIANLKNINARAVNNDTQ